MIIFRYPHPMLITKALEVKQFGKNLEALCKRMFKIMKKNRGIGLAGNQTGNPLAIVVMNIKGHPKYYINPVITEASENITIMEEGCLSFPGMSVHTKRPDWVEVQYQNTEGETFKRKFEGLAARCIQHEIDHLHGVTFVEEGEDRGKHAIDITEYLEKLKEQDPEYHRKLDQDNIGE